MLTKATPLGGDVVNTKSLRVHAKGPFAVHEEGLAHEGDAEGGDVVTPSPAECMHRSVVCFWVGTQSQGWGRSPRRPVHEEGLADEGGDVVTLSTSERTETPQGFPVHEEGLEPPHLAVPEPKSRCRVASGSEWAPGHVFGGAARDHSRPFGAAVDDWETIRGPAGLGRQSLLVRGGTHAYAHAHATRGHPPDPPRFPRADVVRRGRARRASR